VETKFAKVGPAHVAYRTFGDGATDIIIFLGEYLPVDAVDEEPRYARCIRRLTTLGRLIVFNRRGVGLSDPPDGPLTVTQQVEDALAVLDHAGSSRAVVFGANVSSMAALQFAAHHPDRVSALIIVNGSARIRQAPDYPFGYTDELLAATAEQTTSTETVENDFDFLSVFAPSVAHDERFRRWWDQAGHRGASPSRARELWDLLRYGDVRECLKEITTPTLVLRRAAVQQPELSQYLADNITGARHVTLPGSDLPWWVGDADAVLDEIESFLGGTGAGRGRRKLATVVFLDVAASTQTAATMGDQRWRDLLATYHELAEREIDRFGGTRVSTSGDGVLATFDMPADAVRCAARIADGVRALEINVRAGVHTGEIEIVDEDVAGIGVHIAARVMAEAGPGEVLVSRTVTDLVTGSGLAFEDRGEHELKGVPGRWALFAVS
jgi:class 3 adenylate cyclase